MVKQEKTGRQQESASTGQWLKLRFLCPAELLEAATDFLAVQSGSGVEQSPETAEGSWLSGFFYLEATEEAEGRAQAAAIVAETEKGLAELFALYRHPLPALERELLADEDWSTSWRQYFKPFAIAPGLVIKPSWESYMPRTDEKVLELDPGMAFGTGQHASTRGALRLMRRSFEERTPSKVLDVGTGTGILAMGAALWGAERVLALDNDPEAVRVARDNVAQNGLSGQVRVEETPLAAVAGSYALVCANIVHDVLVELLPQFRRVVGHAGHLVLAGILAGAQEENLATLYNRAGFRLLASEYEEEWVALLFAC